MPSNNFLNKTRLALTVVILAFSTAQAGTISVDTIIDLDSDDGICTLREAIVSINNTDIAATGCTVVSGVLGTDDTITFDPSLNNQTIGLTLGALSIVQDVVINGPGVLTIDGSGNGTAGIFSITNSTVELNGLTISGGVSSASGGGVFASGSIVSLTDSAVSGNSATGSGAGGGGISITDLSDLSLINSTVSDNLVTGFGGGIFSGGSNVSLDNSVVSGNSATGAGAGGGGIYSNVSTTSLTNNSIVSDNTAVQQGGGIATIGLKEGVGANFIDSTISGNTSIRGGGIFVHDSIASLSNSALSGNSALTTNGGGIFVNGTSTANLTDSTVSGNSAKVRGGGVFVSGPSIVNLANSTVSGNLAVGGEEPEEGDGGGIFASAGSTANLTNTTVSGNSAVDDGGGISADDASTITLVNSTLTENMTTHRGGGFFINRVSILNLTNSIVSGNSYTAPPGGGMLDGGGAEIRIEDGASSTVNADNNNVLGDSSHSNEEAFDNFLPNLSGSDLVATSDGDESASLPSILDPLADNGGPTQTHALWGNSIAIDAGDDAVCTSVPVNSLDQRGSPRPQGTHCDIGAFELIHPSLTIVKNVTNDHGGDAVAGDFTLRVSGGIYDGSVARNSEDDIPVVTSTAYTVSEDSFLGYSQTGIVCRDDDSSDDLGHPVTLNEGQSATCTISNDDDPPGLKIIKEVIGGSAVPGDFTLHITGGIYDGSVDRISGDIIDVPAEVAYTLSEDPFGGYTQSDVVCVDSSTGDDIGHPVTLTLGQAVTCTISNTYDTFFVIPLPNGGASVFNL